MRYPNILSYKKWIRYEMVFFLGIIMGSMIFLLFFGKELDRLHLQIDSLQNENEHYAKELAGLKESQEKANKARKWIVDDVEVHILDPKPDPFTESELIREIETDTKYLEGKSLQSVRDLHLSLRQQFKNREYNIGNRKVSTELRTMIIDRTVHLYIYAKTLTVTPP